MLRNLLCLGVLALGAAAQDIPNGVKYDLTDLFYPRVGRLARVQGTVKLELIPNGAGQEVKLLGGPALLVQRPKDNLARWRTDRPLSVNYVFRLGDPEIVKVKVPKGDAFDRMVLRLLHLATYTEVSQCRELGDLVNNPRLVQESPLTIKVEIVARVGCLNTETSLVAAR